MAATPKYKVYTADGVYAASCKEVEAAGALASFYGFGTTIRFAHSKSTILWTEGADGASGESYDVVAETCAKRENEIQVQVLREGRPGSAAALLERRGIPKDADHGKDVSK